MQPTWAVICRGGTMMVSDRDRLHVIHDDGTRATVPAAELTPFCCVAGLGRVLSVTPLTTKGEA